MQEKVMVLTYDRSAFDHAQILPRRDSDPHFAVTWSVSVLDVEYYCRVGAFNHRPARQLTAIGCEDAAGDVWRAGETSSQDREPPNERAASRHRDDASSATDTPRYPCHLLRRSPIHPVRRSC